MPLGGAFDPSLPADIIALRDEYFGDPITQGYRGPPDYWGVEGNTQALTQLINSASVSGATKSSSDFTGYDYTDAITTTGAGEDAERAEVLRFDQPTLDGIAGAIDVETALSLHNKAQGERDVNLRNAQFFSEFREEVISGRYQSALLRPWSGLATGTALIRQHLIDLAQGPKSRAEELWTDGTEIREQWTRQALALGDP